MKLVTSMLRKSLLKVWSDGARLNNDYLISYIEHTKTAKILDIGCDTGELVIERVRNIDNPNIYGIDIEQKAVIAARKRGLRVVKADVEKGLPFPSNSFDIVSANQIIEHLVEVDFFIEEIHRVLKPDGYLVLATENLSSWHNILALILGWQDFSHYMSKKKNIGNPLRIDTSNSRPKSTMHIKIFTLRSLKELLELYNFRVEKFFGTGYYPFAGRISRILSKLDPTHCAFIGLKARKLVKSNK